MEVSDQLDVPVALVPSKERTGDEEAPLDTTANGKEELSCRETRCYFTDCSVQSSTNVNLQGTVCEGVY